MARSRLPWYAIGPAVLVGVAAALVVVVWWLLGGGGGVEVNSSALRTAVDSVATPETRDQAAPDAGERGPIIGALEGRIADRLAASPVPTRPITGALRIAVTNIHWRDEAGRSLARIPAASARLDGGRMRSGDVILRDVDVRGGTVLLVQHTNGGWNYEQPMAGLLEGGGGGPPRTVLLAGVRLRGVRVDVETTVRDFSLRDLDASLTEVVFSRPGLPEPLVRVATLETVLEVEDFEEPIPLVAYDAVLRVPEGSVPFTAERVVVEASSFTDIAGVWNPDLGGWGVRATGRAPALAFEELGELRPRLLPERGTASFGFRIEPAANDLNLVVLSELDAAAADSRVGGTLSFLMSTAADARLLDAELTLDPLAVSLLEPFTGPLPYTGVLRGNLSGSGGLFDFDLVADLTADTGERLAAELEGQLVLDETGGSLRRLVAEVDEAPLAALAAYIPGLPFTGTISGRVALTGPPTAAPLDVEVRFELGGGVVTAAGMLDLTGAVPVYDVEGRLLGVQPDLLLAPTLPPAALTARYTLAGRGTDPATMVARFTVNGRFTGWQTGTSDTLAVTAALGSGTLDVVALEMGLATLDLTAAGQWRFVEPVEGSVTYDLTLASLEPFGPYVPLIGDGDAEGSLVASGSVSGPLSALRAEGSFEGTELRVGAWAVAGVDATYGGVLRERRPEGEIALTFTDLRTPTAGDFAAGTLELTAEPPAVALALNAERVGGGGVQLVADGTMPRTGPRDLILRSATLDPGSGPWVLAQPAAVRWGDVPGVQVDSLEVVNQATAGRLFVAGTVWPPGQDDARVEVAGLPVGDIQELLGMPPRLGGVLSGSATITGPTEAPTIDGAFSVLDGQLGGVPFESMEGTIDYGAGELRATLTAALDTAGALRAEIALPADFVLGTSPSFALRDAGAVRGVLTADSLALSPLGQLSPRVTAVTGRVTGDVSLAGTVDAPQFDGALRLAGGGLTVLELNKRYEQAAGRVVFAGRTATVEGLTVLSGGTAELSGTILFEDIAAPVLALDLALREFEVMGINDRDDAAFTGDLDLTGPFSEPVLTGRVAIHGGTVPVPRFGSRLQELDIYAPPPPVERADEGGPSFAEALRIRNLVVDVREDAWFELDEARAQLSGELTVNRAGDELRVTGTLEGTRGTYVLLAGPIVRQFELVSAQVRFLGSPEPNPALDITARRAIIDPTAQPFEVTVRVGGTLRSPTLGLASADAPSIPESELLSFLLFGRPSFAVQGGGLPGEALLQETVWGGFTELLSVELSQEVAEQLSLDLLTIRLGGGGIGDFGGATLVLGRELDEDLFLTVESSVGGILQPADAVLNTWAARLEWAFDRRSTLRLGIEPVYRGRLIRGIGAVLPNNRSQQQFILDVRRRWTY